MKVFSENEWSPLRSVLLGQTFNTFNMNIDLSFKMFFNDIKDWGYATGSEERVEIKGRYIEELKEDLIEFGQALNGCGVETYVPYTLDKVQRIQTPEFSSEMIPALNVRDQAIVIGNTIIETAPMQRCRYFENELFRNILIGAFNDGANWLQMPKARLSDIGMKCHVDMMIDGAQFVRFGKDIIVNVTNKAHKMAVKWIRRQLPEYRFHEIEFPVENHLDSYIVPLCQGTLLVRNMRATDYLPSFLKDWKIIVAPEATENHFPTYDSDDVILTSPYIDMNVLSVNGKDIICNELFPELGELLGKEGFNPIAVQHRHRRIFAGGFHCFTLDLHRGL